MVQRAPSARSTDATCLDLSVIWGLSFFWGLQEFEIELEGSQTLRILCYEKCYNKTKIAKEDGETTDRIDLE